MTEENTKVEHSQILSTGIENYENLKDITTLVYVLQAVALLIPPTAIVAVIINYVKRSEVKGSILESHFRWQIRTFWFSLLWFGLASILIFTIIGGIIGYPILVVAYIWWIYRVVKGWLNLNKKLPMYSSG